MSTILDIPRGALTPHPLLELHPSAGQAVSIAGLAPEAAQEALRLREHFSSSLRELGVMDYLDVCEVPDQPGSYWILDGRHRWESSTELTFTCRVHPAEDAETVICAKLLDRRHVSQEQRAWFIIATWPQLATTERRGGRPPKNCQSGERFSLRGFSERYGIDLDTLSEARRTWLLAEEKGQLRAASASIWHGTSLGAVRAGLAGREATKGKPRAAVHYAALASRAVKSFQNTFRQWDRLPMEERAAIKQQITTLLRSLPADLQSELQHTP